jgi:hypothetical protein
MISKNRSSRFAHGLAAAVLAVGFTAACGDDGPPVVDPDGGPDAEQPCEGHACPPNSPTMLLGEGGDFRYELFHMGYDEEGNKIEVLGGWSFLFKGQTPAARAILGPLVTENIEYPGEGDAYCFNQTEANYYLSGWSAKGQIIVDTREYYDVGESLSVTKDGGGPEILMPRHENKEDPSTLLVHDYLYLTAPEAAADLDRGVKYPLPQIGQVNEFPGLDLRGGVNVPANQEWTDSPAMYFPHDFTFTSPTEEEYFAAPLAANGGLQIDRSQDFTFAWDQAAQPAGFPTQVQFTGFLNADQTFQYLCITPTDGTPATRTQVIPSGLFSQPDFPTTGKLIHGTLTHVAWAQRDGEEEYRFDVIGVNCKFSWYTLVDAQ